MASPKAPDVDPNSPDPADQRAWDDYYAACEEEIELNKPGMRDRQ